MKFFLVEGIIKNPSLMNKNLLKEHMDYSQKAMDDGLILMSGLKSNMSGGLSIMKAEYIETVEDYLSSEPFKVHDILDYKVTEFSPHYFSQSISEYISTK